MSALGPLLVLGILFLQGLGCSNEVDAVFEATLNPDGTTPTPFPFSGVESAFIGVSGSYPYVLLYEDPFTCEDLQNITDHPGLTFTNILILVGGWEEGNYPIYDVLNSGGAYTLEGNAIAYMAERRVPTLEEQAGGYSSPILVSVEYAATGFFQVDSINQLSSTAKGAFQLDFEAGALSADFVIRDFCDIY